MPEFQMEIQCKFKMAPVALSSYGRCYYTCVIENQHLRVDENQEVRFCGDHLGDNALGQVKSLQVMHCQLHQVPKYFGTHFKFISSLSINHCGLKEVTRESFARFDRLEVVNLSHNELTFIPGDLFTGNSNWLRSIYIAHNKLEIVEYDLLQSVQHNTFKYIDLSSNPNIDYTAVSDKKWTLDQVRKDLFEIYKAAVINLKKKLDSLKQQIADQKKELEAVSVKFAATLTDDVKSYLMDDVKSYLMNDDFKDFTVIVDGQNFKVHKMILAARSSVFAQIIITNPDAVELKMTDIPVETFAEVLEFIYHDRLPMRVDRLSLLIKGALKLDIQALKGAIIKKMSDVLSEENALDTLELAVINGIPELKAKAIEEIQPMFPSKKLKIDSVEQCRVLKQMLEMIK
jgi:hypothetical protein